ncbi:hypothetical protein CEV31_3958 [Brucella thiophenivorans]|uniref:Uncharacterized protein n=1 Tax=Brucella thiophenivorans TaxID=571255 RepID=A0A256F1T3_9HYPH|nr:hypothetical protein CEV31_3958 [Brucella thiophenivorans]
MQWLGGCICAGHYFFVAYIELSRLITQFLQRNGYQAIVKHKSSTNFVYYRIIF